MAFSSVEKPVLKRGSAVRRDMFIELGSINQSQLRRSGMGTSRFYVAPDGAGQVAGWILLLDMSRLVALRIRRCAGPPFQQS